MYSPDNPNALKPPFVTDTALRMRQEIYERYSVPRVDYPAWVLNRLHWRGNERVLDVGSGAGYYYPLLHRSWPNIAYRAVDLSAPMLAAHPAKSMAAQADVEQLPYPSGAFDVVMANHMLFHVRDLDQSISEIRRVLGPNGVLLAATNSMHTMPELQALLRRAIVLLGVTSKGQVQPPPLPHYAFSLESGARRLARHFYAVVRYDLPTALVFPDVEPVMTFLESTRELRESQLPAGVTWDDLMTVMRELVVALLSHFGEIVINRLSGVLVASDHGGFINEFASRANGGRR